MSIGREKPYKSIYKHQVLLNMRVYIYKYVINIHQVDLLEYDDVQWKIEHNNEDRYYDATITREPWLRNRHKYDVWVMSI